MNKYDEGNYSVPFTSFDKFSQTLMNTTQDKMYSKRLWHKNFSSVGRTDYWDKVFHHVSGMFGGVLEW